MEELPIKIKNFITWLDHPKCIFTTCYNGTDDSRPKICYEKGNKHYTLDQVWEYYLSHEK